MAARIEIDDKLLGVFFGMVLDVVSYSSFMHHTLEEH
jgi:hypothetical protein